MTDDIVTRLRELLDGPVPMSVERQDVRDAANEIERLREQIDDCEDDFHTLRSMFDRVRAERDHSVLKKHDAARSIKTKALEEWANAHSLESEERADQFTDVEEFDISLFARLRLQAKGLNGYLKDLLNEAADSIKHGHEKTKINDTIPSDSVNILLERLSSASRSMWISDIDGDAVLEAMSLIVEQDKKIRKILGLFNEHYTCEYCGDRSATHLATCRNPLHALHEMRMGLSGM